MLDNILYILVAIVLLTAIMLVGGYNILFLIIGSLFIFLTIWLENICYKIKKQHTLKTFYNDNKCNTFAKIIALVLLVLFLTLTDFNPKG